MELILELQLTRLQVGTVLSSFFFMFSWRTRPLALLGGITGAAVLLSLSPSMHKTHPLLLFCNEQLTNQLTYQITLILSYRFIKEITNKKENREPTRTAK